jgi:outer membrane receptor protein involved in Fe transport
VSSPRPVGAPLRALRSLALAVAALVVATSAYAASAPGTGTVAGRVSDTATGAPLEGVTVVLQGATPDDGSAPREEARTTAADGSFLFESVPPGTYRVAFRAAGYRESTMTDLVVEPDQVRRADFPLPRAAAAAEPGGAPPVEEFIVTAQKVEDLMTVRLESDQLLNVVGAEEFSKFAAGDVAEVLERVAGVNVVEGQFAIIRGLEDRYSSTLYNGAPVPSPDPDRQSVQLDLFPSDVVSNLSVSKTFSPELPSNSSGGAIDVVSHDYPQEIELSLKAGTGYNTNADDRFLHLQGDTDVDLVLDGLPASIVNGMNVYPDLAELKKRGFRFIGGNPVGREEEEGGSWLDDLEDILESDFNGSLGGRKEFGGREFRFKLVGANEIDYSTAEGFEEVREPRGPVFGPDTFVFIPVPPFVMTVPGQFEQSADLSLGKLSLSEGRYDVTLSQREEQRTGYAAFGLDLDEEGNHKIDASYFYTRKQEEAVELKENGFLPGFDYAEAFNGQLAGVIDPTLYQGVTAPGSFIAGSFRDRAFDGPGAGALAFASFAESTSYQRDRDLWVAQINGDHRFEPFSGLHFSWAINRARTTQDDVALGMKFFFEPCGYSSLVPCEPGTSATGVPTSFPASASALGAGRFAARNNLTLSANSIEEESDFYRLDADYEIDFSEASRFTAAGGVWFERADRDVRSAFLETPTVEVGSPSRDCFAGTSTSFVCLGNTPSDTGRAVFDELGASNGDLAGLRQTGNESTREIDAWHLRGKFTLWERVDLLGGVRGETILIESLNDPFLVNPVTGELVTILGGPQTFPSRYLFFDRLDNPFSRPTPTGIVQEVTTPPPPDFAYNDQILGTGVTPGPCLGDDGSRPGIQCVDLVDRAVLEDFFNGRIDERRLLPSAGLAFRPIEGLTLRGAWSETVARPSFREMGYYVSVEPGSDDLIVGNPKLELSDVESWDARAEYTWGSRGDLVALSYFTKEIERPIESIIVRDPTNAELSGSSLYRTFFNNPNTADLWGLEAEARKSIDFFGTRAPDWLKYFSIGGNFTYISAEVARTEAELIRSEPFFGTKPGDVQVFDDLSHSRRLFNQPKWIANADVTFDYPDWGVKATLAYFAISDVLDAAGTATLGPTGDALAFTLDRYVDSFYELRATASKTFELPGSLGELTFRVAGKNLTDTRRRLIYDPDQTAIEIPEREFKLGLDYDVSIGFTRRF